MKCNSYDTFKRNDILVDIFFKCNIFHPLVSTIKIWKFDWKKKKKRNPAGDTELPWLCNSCGLSTLYRCSLTTVAQVIPYQLNHTNVICSDSILHSTEEVIKNKQTNKNPCIIKPMNYMNKNECTACPGVSGIEPGTFCELAKSQLLHTTSTSKPLHGYR